MASRLGADTIDRLRVAWPDILETVANGDHTCTLRTIAATYGLSLSSLQQYIRQTPNARAELDAAYEDNAEVATAAIPTIINSCKDKGIARVMAEYVWKLAAARCPARYSERRQIDMRVQALDMSEALREAQRRLQQREQALLGKDVTQAGVTLGSVAQLAELL